MNEFINDKMIGKGNSPNLGGGDGFPHMCVNRYEHAYCQVVIVRNKKVLFLSFCFILLHACTRAHSRVHLSHACDSLLMHHL